MKASEATKTLKNLGSNKKMTIHQSDAIEFALECIQTLATLPIQFTSNQLAQKNTMTKEEARIYGIAVNDCTNIVLSKLKYFEENV